MPEAIKEHDRVVLTASIPSHGLVPGGVGAVVHVHAGGAFEVEFFTLLGQTTAVATLDSGQVRPVNPRDVLHIRPLTDG
jgi:hypothetical protein